MAELTLFHVHTRSMGYGRYGTELFRALSHLGIDVYDSQPMPDEARYTHETDVHSRSAPHPTNVVAWVSTPTHARGWWDGQYRVIACMWEAMRLPETFRESLHCFDRIVVPSHHNLELFSRYHDDVTFVPLGVDPEVWHYEPRVPPEGEFRFLVAGSGDRKGTDLAFAAFRKLWPSEGSWGSGPVPYLMMKNPRREQFGGPRVEVIGGKIPSAAEVDLYATAHCYLGPARGEGFGLQPLQALAQGCPTILTAAHGHDSFAHLGLPISASPAKASYFVYGDAGEWWEPDLDELCDRMRWVYDNYDAAVVQAAAASQVVAEEFTWQRTAERFVEAIGPERLEVPYPRGLHKWVAPTLRRYLVVTNRDWPADIAGISYLFRKGERYHELADVKRILWEANVLDPVCVVNEEDHGLAPEQVPDIESYSARHSYCEMCGVKLGTGIRRADVLEQEDTDVTAWIARAESDSARTPERQGSDRG